MVSGVNLEWHRAVDEDEHVKCKQWRDRLVPALSGLCCLEAVSHHVQDVLYGGGGVLKGSGEA